MGLIKGVILKSAESLIIIVLLVLHFHTPWGIKIGHDFLASGAILGFLIIQIARLFGQLTLASLPTRIDLFFTLIGAGLFILAGGFYFQEPYTNDDIAVTKSYLFIVNGFIFLLDTVCSLVC